MAETKLKETVHEEEEKEEADNKSFEELGVDARLLRALQKKEIEKPTPIQAVAIPLILVTFLSSFIFRHSPFNFTWT